MLDLISTPRTPSPCSPVSRPSKTTSLPALLTICYDEIDVVTTEIIFVPTLLQTLFLVRNPGHNQQTISRAVKEQGSEHFWAPTEIETKDLPFEDKVKGSCFNLITTKETRAWQNILPGRKELTPETWTLWLQLWIGAAVYDRKLDGCKPSCRHFCQPMEIFGWYSFGNCATG